MEKVSGEVGRARAEIPIAEKLVRRSERSEKERRKSRVDELVVSIKEKEREERHAHVYREDAKRLMRPIDRSTDRLPPSSRLVLLSFLSSFSRLIP